MDRVDVEEFSIPARFFGEAELEMLRDRATVLEEASEDPHWRSAYRALAGAADRVHAMIVRAQRDANPHGTAALQHLLQSMQFPAEEDVPEEPEAPAPDPDEEPLLEFKARPRSQRKICSICEAALWPEGDGWKCKNGHVERDDGKA